ncbi:MAG: lipid II:glycine glycyltransferase FemX [Flexilinea sp.]
MAQITSEQWQALLSGYPEVSILQTAEWGRLKSSFGWTPTFLANETAGSMVLFRKLHRLAPGLTIAYIPRGPIAFNKETPDFRRLWEEIHRLCRSKHAIFLRVEPDEWQDTPEAALLINSMNGFHPGFATIQPPNTILLSLEGSEGDWLSRMNQKTRYNIRLSQKKDLVVEESDDLLAFSRLMEQTGSRDDFGVHSPAYYQKCYDCFKPGNQVRLLQTSYQGKPLSALMLFIRGKRGYYLYGASSNEERSRMPNHLLQWAAMKTCAENGCTEYDLWGIPDESEETLEAQFQERQEGLWSVYRFKRGFGGVIKRTIGTYDFVYLPLLYRMLAAFIRNKKQ